jgi:hypothetical protein
MKRKFLKLSAVAIVVVALFCLGFFSACEEKDDKNEKIQKNTTIVNEVVIDNNTRLTLSNVFSDENMNIRQMQSDTLFNIINDMQGLFVLGLDSDVNIDFENNCIIWGKVVSPNTSGAILSNNLYYNSQDLSYRYEINVYVSETGYTARKNLYFWGVYPKPNQNVLFVLNYNN